MAPHRTNDRDALAQLDSDRGRNDQKLKSRFEHIFRKYEHDFTGVGDEFDIHTDEILVNNGHLEHMRSEVDSGKSASSRFVKDFRDKLAHEDESTSGSDEDEEGEEGEQEEDEEEEDQGDSRSQQDAKAFDFTNVITGMRRSPRHGQGSSSEQSTPQPVTRPPPRLPSLMQFLAGNGTSESPLEIPDDDASENSFAYETASSVATPTLHFNESVLSRRSMTVDSRATSARHTADEETVHALGMSIANQLAKLMGATAKKKSARKSSSMRRGVDPIWDYPELCPASKSKRKRDVSPPTQPQTSSPRAATPGSCSLWAVPDPEQSSKRRRREIPARAAKASACSFDPARESSEAKRCWNCGLTRSQGWHKGPHDQDLCQSCWQYYDHHGRMKPFDSATPPPSRPPPVREAPAKVEQRKEPATSDAHSERQEPVTTVAHGLTQDSTATAVHEGVMRSGKSGRDGMGIPPVAITPLERAESRKCAEKAPDQLSSMPVVNPTQQPVMETESRVSNALQTAMVEQSDSQTAAYTANTSRPIVWTPPGPMNMKWTPEDDALVIKLKEQQNLPWSVIAQYFPRCSPSSVQKAYSSRMRGRDIPGRVLFNARLRADNDARLIPGTSTKPHWSAQEDEDLLSYREDDELEWEDIAGRMPGRSASDVERRYDQLARADDDSGNFDSAERRSCRLAPRAYTAEEDALLLRLRDNEKLSWQAIAKHFRNRSQSSLKGHYSLLNNAGDATSTRRTRHSLPAVLPTMLQRPGNALLRQAIGNSHRRRSHIAAFPAATTDLQSGRNQDVQFALDPALRALSNAARPGSYPSHGVDDALAASLQLEEEMQRAHQSSPSIAAAVRQQAMTEKREQASQARAPNVQQPALVGDLPRSRSSQRPRTPDHVDFAADPTGRSPPMAIAVYSPEPPAQPMFDSLTSQDGSNSSQSISGSHQTSLRHGKDASTETPAHDAIFESGISRPTRSKRATASKNTKGAMTLRETHSEFKGEAAPMATINNPLDSARPPEVPWTEVVARAFESSADGQISTREIFKWIELNFTNCTTASKSWKDLVREELRSNSKYEQSGRSWRLAATEQSKRQGLRTVARSDDSTSDKPVNVAFQSSDAANHAAVETTSQQKSRRVTFSPVVTVCTPVPIARPRPRGRPRKHGLRDDIPRKEPAEAAGILDCGLEMDTLASSNTPAPAKRTVSRTKDPHAEFPVPKPSSRAIKTRKSRAHKVATDRRVVAEPEPELQPEPAIEPVLVAETATAIPVEVTTESEHAAQLPRSPSSSAFVKPGTPASIYKTPKQRDCSRVARLNSMSASVPRKPNTPIINYRQFTPNASVRKRFVQTPMRELMDPHEDELA